MLKVASIEPVNKKLKGYIYGNKLKQAIGEKPHKKEDKTINASD